MNLRWLWAPVPSRGHSGGKREEYERIKHTASDRCAVLSFLPLNIRSDIWGKPSKSAICGAETRKSTSCLEEIGYTRTYLKTRLDGGQCNNRPAPDVAAFVARGGIPEAGGGPGGARARARRRHGIPIKLAHVGAHCALGLLSADALTDRQDVDACPLPKPIVTYCF